MVRDMKSEKNWRLFICSPLLAWGVLVGTVFHVSYASHVYAAPSPKRVVSLDYCADQFVLQFVARENILALSPDATKPFSYLRTKALGLPQTLSHSERVLALKPDLVVRSYGGGAGGAAMATGFYEAAQISVVQLPYVNRMANIAKATRRISIELGNRQEGERLAQEFEHFIGQQGAPKNASMLYMTPGGLTAGRETLIGEMIRLAGYDNFETRSGWQTIPLEKLARVQPNRVVFASFGTGYEDKNNWTAVTHPIAKNIMDERVRYISGALTSCTAWFLMDAIKRIQSENPKMTDGQ